MSDAWIGTPFTSKFVTLNPNALGVAVAPDSTPTYAITVEGNDTPLLTGSAVQTTGVTYEFHVTITPTLASGFLFWRKHFLRINATIGGGNYPALQEFYVLPPQALDRNIAFVCTTTGGTSTTAVLDATASTSNNAYQDQRVVKISTANPIETNAVVVGGYNGSTKTITVLQAWLSVPANGDFLVFYADQMGTAQALSNTELATFQSLLTTHIDLSAAAIATGTVDTTAFTPTTTIFQTSSITSASTSFWVNNLGIFSPTTLTAALRDLRFVVTAYSLVGGRGQFTVILQDRATSLPAAPISGDAFVLV